jgi:hypothetical protein
LLKKRNRFAFAGEFVIIQQQSTASMQQWLNTEVCRNSLVPRRELGNLQGRSLFAWLISHQPTILFSQNKPATSNQTAVLFSQNKPAPAISHQPNKQAAVTGLC